MRLAYRYSKGEKGERIGVRNKNPASFFQPDSACADGTIEARNKIGTASAIEPGAMATRKTADGKGRLYILRRGVGMSKFHSCIRTLGMKTGGKFRPCKFHSCLGQEGNAKWNEDISNLEEDERVGGSMKVKDSRRRNIINIWMR